MNTTDSFDAYARSMTHRLLKAAESDPAKSLDERSTTVPRTVAMLVTTLALVAGLIVVGTSVLHLQLSHGPVNVATPPPVITQAPTPTPTTTPSPTATPTSVIANVHMITATLGWAQRQSDGAILHTTHGVMTWAVATPRIGNQDIIAVAFIDAETARALTAVIPPDGESVSTVIHSWATNDGGATWIDEGSFSGIALQYEPDGTPRLRRSGPRLVLRDGPRCCGLVSDLRLPNGRRGPALVRSRQHEHRPWSRSQRAPVGL